MTLEFKDAPGNALLAIDGQLTAEGLKRQAAGGIEFKVVNPSDLQTADSAQVARVGRINTLSREIQASLDRQRASTHIAADHPVVQWWRQWQRRA